MKLLLSGLLLLLAVGIQAHPPRNAPQHVHDHGKPLEGFAQGAAPGDHESGGGHPRVVRQVHNMVQKGGRNGQGPKGFTEKPGNNWGHNGGNPKGSQPNRPPQ